MTHRPPGVRSLLPPAPHPLYDCVDVLDLLVGQVGHAEDDGLVGQLAPHGGASSWSATASPPFRIADSAGDLEVLAETEAVNLAAGEQRCFWAAGLPCA